MTTTPGPWLVHDNSTLHMNDATIADVGRHLKVVTHNNRDGIDGRQCLANARLMAAAPDLLAVARLAIEVLALQRAYFRTRAQSDLIASKQAESRLAKMATAAVSRVDVP